jgi:aspartyl-tRNA(Asn)/glutamyl-tRNA(Gln) amidotransferase subunit A
MATAPSLSIKICVQKNYFNKNLNDLMTIPANLAGLPGISLPCGFDSKGLPIGLQIVGKVLGEEQLFQVAYAYEQSTNWHLQKPKMA